MDVDAACDPVLLVPQNKRPLVSPKVAPKKRPPRVHPEETPRPLSKQSKHVKVSTNRWARLKVSWTQAFRLPHSTETWITTVFSKEHGMRLGCLACKNAGVNSVFGRADVPMAAAQKSVFANHSRTKSHCRAVVKWAGRDPDALGVPVDLAPTREEFQTVLSLTRKGQLPEHLPNVGHRKKLRRMKWCLAEARRMVKRQYLKSSRVVSLHQDARKGRLAVRFTCCGPKLKPKVGFLGSASLTSKFSTDAGGIKQAIVHIVHEFCTPLRRPPMINLSRTSTSCDTSLVAHLRQSVELLDSDAAADETLAAKVLTGIRTEAGKTVPFFPRVKVQNRDKAHASRRTCPKCLVTTFSNAELSATCFGNP